MKRLRPKRNPKRSTTWQCSVRTIRVGQWMNLGQQDFIDPLQSLVSIWQLPILASCMLKDVAFRETSTWPLFGTRLEPSILDSRGVMRIGGRLHDS